MDDCHPFRPLTTASKDSRADALRQKFKESVLKLSQALHQEAVVKAERAAQAGHSCAQVETESHEVALRVMKLLEQDGFSTIKLIQDSQVPASIATNWWGKKTVHYIRFSF